MKSYLLIILSLLMLSGIGLGQGTYVLNDPNAKPKPAVNMGPTEKLLQETVLPKIRKVWSEESCTDGFNITGHTNGAFTKAGAKQTLVFFEYCQTGNGFGNNGLALIENDKVIQGWSSEGGWPLDVVATPDINKNGRDEFMFYYSGGMHQGEGGVGVDLMELDGSKVGCIGWFLSERFTENDEFVWKVTVKPGSVPVFYQQKHVERKKKWVPSGKVTKLTLKRDCCKFDLLN